LDDTESSGRDEGGLSGWDDSNSIYENVAEMVKNFNVEISGSKGWKDAQVTVGGVSLSEIDPITGQCQKVPGLYFTGEALDLDFICGGYNLSNAWLTGIKAGRHAAKE
jgi:predicted flavoprotein YhiN